MRELQTYCLQDVCSKIGSGATPSGGKNAYCDSGVSLIRSQNVLDFEFSENGLAFINNEQADKLRGVTVESGDVLINITGDSVARVCIVPDRVLPARVNQHVCIVRADEGKICRRYLEYYLISIKDHLLTIASAGATRNALTKDFLANLEIQLPTIGIQQRIAAVLSSLDDKIENNHKMCKNLEEQAQAIFKSWFVDFEPFGGEMPKEWRLGQLSDLANVIRDSIAPGEMPDVVEHYSLPAFDKNCLPAYEKSATILSSKFRLTKGVLLISKLNPRIRRLWDPSVDSDSAVSSTEFVVLQPQDGRSRGYLYSILASDGFYEYSCANAAGTTNSHQRISPEDILNFPVCLPDDQTLMRFSSVVEPMMDKAKAAHKESGALAELRDALLPKLMSGEIDVDKVEIP